MGRIERGLQLMGQSYRVLMQDKELMLLPVLSGVAILVVIVSFAIPVLATSGGDLGIDEGEGPWLLAFLFYVVSYTVSFYFQAALVAGACERMAGGDPTVGSALRAANQRFGAILLWGVIAATVGMIIRTVQERSELVGRIVMGLLGVVWSLATYFMVPVLVMEERSIGDSFKQSWNLFKKTWGENFTGNFGFGLIAMVSYILLFAVLFALATAGLGIVAIVLGVLGVAALSVFFTAVNGVFQASLYRYATVGEAPDGFDRELLQTAFHPR